MDIKESNKLIADFLGIPKCGRCEDCGAYQYSPDIIFFPDDMKYFDSWDWIMTVVYQIESQKGLITIQSTKCSIWHPDFETYKDEPIFIDEPAMTKLESVYKAVVEYIEWYNKQTPKTT